MKTKNCVLKTVAALLAGGMLLSGSCTPDNYWADLLGGAGMTAVNTAVAEAVLDQVNENVNQQ